MSSDTTTTTATVTVRKSGSPDDTFVLFLATVVAWFTLEFWRVLRGQESISGQVWALAKTWPPIGYLSGFIMGTLGAHFFFGQCGE